MDSWERLMDKDEDKNHEFFVIRENFLKQVKEEEDRKNEALGVDTSQSTVSV